MAAVNLRIELQMIRSPVPVRVARDKNTVDVNNLTFEENRQLVKKFVETLWDAFNKRYKDRNDESEKTWREILIRLVTFLINQLDSEMLLAVDVSESSTITDAENWCEEIFDMWHDVIKMAEKQKPLHDELKDSLRDILGPKTVELSNNCFMFKVLKCDPSPFLKLITVRDENPAWHHLSHLIVSQARAVVEEEFISHEAGLSECGCKVLDVWKDFRTDVMIALTRLTEFSLQTDSNELIEIWKDGKTFEFALIPTAQLVKSPNINHCSLDELSEKWGVSDDIISVLENIEGTEYLDRCIDLASDLKLQNLENQLLKKQKAVWKADRKDHNAKMKNIKATNQCSVCYTVKRELMSFGCGHDTCTECWAKTPNCPYRCQQGHKGYNRRAQSIYDETHRAEEIRKKQVERRKQIQSNADQIIRKVDELIEAKRSTCSKFHEELKVQTTALSTKITASFEHDIEQLKEKKGTLERLKVGANESNETIERSLDKIDKSVLNQERLKKNRAVKLKDVLPEGATLSELVEYGELHGSTGLLINYSKTENMAAVMFETQAWSGRLDRLKVTDEEYRGLKIGDCVRLKEEYRNGDKKPALAWGPLEQHKESIGEVRRMKHDKQGKLVVEIDFETVGDWAGLYGELEKCDDELCSSELEVGSKVWLKEKDESIDFNSVGEVVKTDSQEDEDRPIHVRFPAGEYFGKKSDIELARRIRKDDYVKVKQSVKQPKAGWGINPNNRIGKVRKTGLGAGGARVAFMDIKGESLLWACFTEELEIVRDYEKRKGGRSSRSDGDGGSESDESSENDIDAPKCAQQ